MFVLFYSCGSKKNTTAAFISQSDSSNIIFLNYSISKDENGKKNVEFINKIIADGKLKQNSNKFLKEGNIGDLKCAQLDNKSKEITSVVIKNPLLKTIEFVNDSLEFEKKAVTLNNAPFSLRLQLNSKTKSISISEIIDTLQNSQPLIITKVN